LGSLSVLGLLGLHLFQASLLCFRGGLILVLLLLACFLLTGLFFGELLRSLFLGPLGLSSCRSFLLFKDLFFLLFLSLGLFCSLLSCEFLCL